MINAYNAVHSDNYDCVNNGMDIHIDLSGQIHYGGRANIDANGNYYITGLDGYLWTDGFLWTDSLTESSSVNTWVARE